MMKMPSSLLKLFSVLFLGVVVFFPTPSQAKDSEAQLQIILLNDSASALEDSDPGLSKSLTKLADEKEKEWEDSNANSDTPQVPVVQKNTEQLQDEIKLFDTAAVEIAPTYPLIAQALKKMADGIKETMKNAKQ